MGTSSFSEDISAGRWSKLLCTTEQQSFKNTIPPVLLRQLELNQRSVIFHLSKNQSLFPLYFASPLSVPMFTEAMRMYPIAPFLERKCCSDYQLPTHTGNGTITLPAGTGVYIPVLGLHFDATYFPEPEKFDPDRFTEENKHSRPNYTYLPFGEGPRMCIGKGRHLILPRNDFSFQSLTIKFMLLVIRSLSVW
jgi:hypothetical protein